MLDSSGEVNMPGGEVNYPRILVLGGAGKTGRRLLQAALERGYEVTTMVRAPERLDDLACKRLKVLRGDLAEPADVAAALTGDIDAVLSTVGIFHKSEATPVADMTEILIRRMQQAGPRRLVVMSSLGVGDSAGQGNLAVKYVTRFVLKYVLRDKALQEERVRASGLDWTILRPPRLLDRDAIAPYHRWQGTAHPPAVKWKISNRDAAVEMLTLLDEGEAIGQAYQCSY